MNKIILMGVPHHNNIGDAAIVYAEKKFLEDNVKNFEIYYVPEETMEKCSKKLVRFIKNNDIIIFHGGGNIGSQYPIIENARRKIIQRFPENRIIIFPQTIYFSKDENGIKEFEKTKEIYNNHRDLNLIARDEKSYEIMKQAFKNNNVILAPDIVMYLNKTKMNVTRDGILVVLRNDVEKNITEEEKYCIENIAKNYTNDLKYIDTVKDTNILQIHRDQILEETFDEFRKSKIVITDRLHGMIFAAITSTPCVVLGNYNHKVSQSSKWLKNLEYIRYVKNVNDVDIQIKELLKLKNCKYNNEFTIKKFQQIIDLIYRK